MDKKTFLLKQLAKTNKKNYENYVVTRIIHGVNDPEVKFVTQQYISRGEKRYALRDLYLPQIKFHIEVDEARHEDDDAITADDVREKDIINSIDLLPVKRVKATLPLDELNKEIDKVVKRIRSLVADQKSRNKFTPWDPETAGKPETYIDKEYMDANDDVAFKRHADACNCFGHNYKQYYRGLAKHPYEPELRIWFPKLYENGDWDNDIINEGKTIIERRKHNNEEFVQEYLKRTDEFRRLVFAHVRGPLGDIMYRFKGLFEVNVEVSRRESVITYNLTDTQARTYPPKQK